MKPRQIVATAVALAVLAGACGTESESTTTMTDSTQPPTTSTTSPSTSPTSSVPPAATGELVRAEVPRTTATDVDDAEIAELVAGNTEFAFDIFRVAGANGGNTMLSPNSIATALTMTYAGARATTAEEMAATLHLALLDDRLHAARNELDLRVTATPPQAPDDDSQPFTISTANSVWGQPDYPFLDAFLDILAEDYDTGMYLADFANDTEAARVAINDWVEEETQGRIQDMIPPGALTAMTRMVLVNAIWFKANWAVPFEPDLTLPGPFTLLDGSTVEADLMRGNIMMPWIDGDGYVAVSIPYAGDADMVVVLPDEGRHDDILTTFGPDQLTTIARDGERRAVDLTMPKFEFTAEFGLKGALEELGMVEAFSPPPGPNTADFSGITAGGELYVQEVVHKSFIKVDEQGTEAAAATAVILGLTSLPERATVTLDRPFLFIIKHRSTGEILFMGQVTNPTVG
jgi:serpin B